MANSLADGAQQTVTIERFPKNLSAVTDPRGLVDADLAARDQDDWQLWTILVNDARELQAIHERHYNVGHEAVNGGEVKLIQKRGSRGEQAYRVAGRLEQAL